MPPHPPQSMDGLGENNSLLISFCEAREKLILERKNTRSMREEAVDAYKTLGNILMESMRKKGIECVGLEGEGGEMVYVKLLTNQRKRVAVREDDLPHLLEGVGRITREVSKEDLPQSIASLVAKRAAERAPPSQDKLQVKKGKVSGAYVPVSHLGKDISQLSSQVKDAYEEKVSIRDRLKPCVRAAKEAEAALSKTLSHPVSVQVNRQGTNSKTLQITPISQDTEDKARREAIEPTIIKTEKRTLGVCKLKYVVEEAARRVERRDDDYEEQLISMATHIFNSELDNRKTTSFSRRGASVKVRTVSVKR